MKTVNMMKKQMWHWCSMLMLICLMGFVACDTAYDNDDWDADDDNFIGEQEYYDGFTSTNWYADWDRNDDDILTNDEFNEGYYGIWDTNNDNYLDENEWGYMNDRYDNDMGTYQDWDTNTDNQIDYNEYNNRVGTNDFSAWDRDASGALSEEEFAGGFFDTWDANNDNRLDEAEYAEWNSVYGTYGS